MEEYKLTHALRLMSSEVTGRTPFCPEEEVIVACFEGRLDEPEQNKLNQHLVDCRFCLASVGNLERQALEERSFTPRADDLAKAKLLANTPRVRSSNRPWLAAAAAVALTVVALSMLGPRFDIGTDLGVNEATNNPTQIPHEPSQVRGIHQSIPRPAIIHPTDGAVLNGNELLVTWTEVRGSLHYDIRLVDSEGFILLNDRIEGTTQWNIPLGQFTRPGQSYFVRVDAYIGEANIAASDHVLFSIGKRLQ